MASKVAVTVTDPFPARAHGLVPLHPPPDQPRNVDPGEGVPVRVTTVPAPKVLEHVEPQLIPAGLLATVPTPVPAFATASVNPPEGLAQAGLEKADTSLPLTAATS
jgi:hypothetical protein